ncbi:hypothetical protein [Paraflavitalea speifideaquila]|nr:hypothetical protein [Paraflavitalea speifideiaquila]
MFIVDSFGVVSNVEAVSGPKELWDAAIKVIKRAVNGSLPSRMEGT